MATESSKSQAPKASSNGNEGGWTRAPKPILVDGFWHQAAGEVIEGVVLDYEKTDGGGYFKVKLARPATVKQRESDQTKQAPKGAVIGVNESASLKCLHQYMKQTNGPIAVLVTCNGKNAAGRWEIDVDWKPAF